MSPLDLRETAEVRWFIPGAMPSDLSAWMRQVASPFPPTPQTLADHYLWTGSDDDNVKLRDDQLERKRLISRRPLRLAGVQGQLERWRSRSRARRPEDAVPGLTTIVHKRRQLAYLVQPEGLIVAARERGSDEPTCTVELAAVTVLTPSRAGQLNEGESAWTLCLEATGGDSELVESVLVWLLETFPADCRKALTAERSMGYAHWLLAHGTGPTVSPAEARTRLANIDV